MNEEIFYMGYQEGKYVSGGVEKPFLDDLYDLEKILEELGKRGFAPEISKIVEKGFQDHWDLKEIEFELGDAGFGRELQEIGTIFRSSKKKKEPRDENN